VALIVCWLQRAGSMVLKCMILISNEQVKAKLLLLCVKYNVFKVNIQTRSVMNLRHFKTSRTIDYIMAIYYKNISNY